MGDLLVWALKYDPSFHQDTIGKPTSWLLIGVNLEEPIGDPAQHGLIHTCLQIRYSAENGTGPTDLVDYSLNHESA